MAGPAHDVLVQALRDDLALLPAILAKLRGCKLPRLAGTVDSAVRFARPGEVRPDVAYRTRRGWVLVEVQNKIDPAKRRRWLLAASILHNEKGQMGDLLILTPSGSVSRWARRLVRLRGPAGTWLALSPVVLCIGLRRARALIDASAPALALAAAWAMQHRHGEAARRIVERAIEVSDHLSPPLREAQWRAIFEVLNDKMKARLHEVAMHPDRVPESPSTRKLRLFLEAMGRKRGRAEGKRESLLVVLRERGLRIKTVEREAIKGCEDVEKLTLWLKRALKASSVADVLGSIAPNKAPRTPRVPRRTSGGPARPGGSRTAKRAPRTAR